MKLKVRTTPVAGLFVPLGIAAILWLGGCESSNRVVKDEPSPTCPICQRETRVNPITKWKYTTCVCPKCGTVTTMDPDFELQVERFTGPNVGDRVYACDSCGNILQDCATCREASP
ncbi:MAG: hypothetical protein ACM3VT_05460 [Solirubrobacterales bacterium]